LCNLEHATYVIEDLFNIVVEGATNHAIIDPNAKDQFQVFFVDINTTIYFKDNEIVCL